jgi:hypothetical protein
LNNNLNNYTGSLPVVKNIFRNNHLRPGRQREKSGKFPQKISLAINYPYDINMFMRTRKYFGKSFVSVLPGQPGPPLGIFSIRPVRPGIRQSAESRKRSAKEARN